MQNLTDRDMGYDLLYGTKSSASTYMTAVLESSSPRCREIFHRLHDDGLRSQWKIWQFLHERQEYRTHPAERQEIDGVRQRMAHLCQTHEIGAQQGAPAGPQGGRWEAEPRNAGGHGAGRWADGREGGRWDDREGRWSEGGYGREAAYGVSGSTYGGPTTGNNAAGGPGAGITFEPDRNMPEGTRFESDRGFAESGSFGATGAGMNAGTSAGGGYGNFGGTTPSSTAAGSAGRHNDAGRSSAGHMGATGAPSWNESGRMGTGGRTGGVSIGASPAESGRRNFGENTWSSDETRKSGRY